LEGFSTVKILVAIKQVPARDSAIHVDAGKTWIDEQDLLFEINEPDAYALEEALQLKDRHGGEVVVLCAGPERAGQTIYGALAKGADRAIHIQCEDLAALNILAVARRLAAVASAEKPDLILTGLQSDDIGQGQTGPVLAELLGIPHATIIMEVEKHDGTIRVKRELENGWFQWVNLPLPALITIQSGISKLRYASLMGIKKAKTKEVKRISGSELDQQRTSPVHRESVYLPRKKKETQIIGGSPDDAAAMLVEKLRFEVRAI
jgi:electron transfer flavoprotein beta subunit